MEIGNILKEARESKNLSLDDIQEITKIQKRYLVAIEQEEFKALPGRFYIRAFIREYAEAVDLDPELVLSEFKEDKDEIVEETVQYTRLDRAEKLNENKATSIFSFIPTLIVILLIVAILFVGWIYYQKSLSKSDSEEINTNETDEIVRHSDEDDTSKEKPVKEEKDTKEEKEEKEEKKKEDSFEVINVGTGNSPESTLNFNVIKEDIKLKIKTTDDTYLELRGGSQEVYFADTLTQSAEENEFDVSNEENIYLNIGNASSVELKINDEKLDFPVDPKQSVHQKLLINFKK